MLWVKHCCIKTSVHISSLSWSLFLWMTLRLAPLRFYVMLLVVLCDNVVYWGVWDVGTWRLFSWRIALCYYWCSNTDTHILILSVIWYYNSVFAILRFHYVFRLSNTLVRRGFCYHFVSLLQKAQFSSQLLSINQSELYSSVHPPRVLSFVCLAASCWAGTLKACSMD